MNDTNQNDTRFDRLVDGELSAEEYRALLAWLDDQPGEWRKCALAFLEAQALSGELGQIRRSHHLSEETPQPSAVSPASVSRPRWFELKTVLAIALSFLFAFTLGTFVPRFFVLRPQEPNFAGNKIPVATPEIGSQPKPVGNVRLVMNGPGDGAIESGDVPVYDVGADWQSFFSRDRPALPPELVELLQQRGHEVERQEQYVPAQLDDGRQVIVPVERYLITPVSERAY